MKEQAKPAPAKPKSIWWQVFSLSALPCTMWRTGGSSPLPSLCDTAPDAQYNRLAAPLQAGPFEQWVREVLISVLVPEVRRQQWLQNGCHANQLPPLLLHCVHHVCAESWHRTTPYGCAGLQCL